MVVSVQDPASSMFHHPTLGQNITQVPVSNNPQRPALGNVTHHIPEVLQLPCPGQENVEGPALEARNSQEMKLCHKKENMHKKSYIDDLTLLEKISLSKLVEKERIIGPLDWHDRFNLTLPSNHSILQHQLLDLTQYTKEHFMVLNSKKTKCIPFVNSKTKDFIPQLSIDEGKYIEVIYQLKLVSVVGWVGSKGSKLGGFQLSSPI